MHTKPPSFIQDDHPYSEMANQYLAGLLAADRHGVSRQIMDAVEAGTSIKDIYLYVFQPTQYEIGRLWQIDAISVAQEHYCTATTQLIMCQLYPHLFTAKNNNRMLVAACAAQDSHEIGLRMVADFFEMEGWNTFYIGANAPPTSVLDSVIQHRADVLGISVSLPSHIDYVRQLIEIVRSSKMGDQIKILVGGYPFIIDPNLCSSVGADATAPDAATAIEATKRLFGEKPTNGNDDEHLSYQVSLIKAQGFNKAPARSDSAMLEMTTLNNELSTLQRQVVQKNAQLEKLNQQKNLLLGMAAHDLRNPLDVICNFSDFLLEDFASSIEAKPYELLTAIKNSSEFMLHLVEELLDISEIEAGELKLNLEPVDLTALIEKNVQLNQSIADKKRIGLKISQPQGLPPLMLDRNKIDQVLNNLISNAIKYSLPDTAVQIHTERGTDQVFVIVVDQGQGIPKDEIDHLFTPFQKTSAKSTAGEKTTGLGLMIVHRIIAGHKGEMKVKSTVGKGSTFYFSLPLSKVDTAAKNQRPASAPAPLADGATIPPLHILVIDDNRLNQMVAVGILRNWGHTVCTADSGRQALTLLANESFDLVLMDLHMPEMDGFETAENIRAKEQGSGQRTPIIAVTADVQIAKAAHSIEAGMDAHITKPIRQPILLQTMRQVLGFGK